LNSGSFSLPSAAQLNAGTNKQERTNTRNFMNLLLCLEGGRNGNLVYEYAAGPLRGCSVGPRQSAIFHIDSSLIT
jgi:hypothetical protein